MKAFSFEEDHEKIFIRVDKILEIKLIVLIIHGHPQNKIQGGIRF